VLDWPKPALAHARVAATSLAVSDGKLATIADGQLVPFPKEASMSRTILFLCLYGSLWLASTPTLHAQTRSGYQPDFNKQFYLFVSPGVISEPDGRVGTLVVGGGGETYLGQRVTAGIEIAESVTHRRFDYALMKKPPRPRGHAAWLTFNGSYHFRRQDSSQRTRPFLTVGCGLSGFDGLGLGEQWNYGAGFNHWRTRHLGVRVEVRRFLHSGDGPGRFTGLRVGLALR
jgi:hypothetical protein